MASPIDKAPLQSKKFWAYLVADFGWKALLVWMIWRDESEVVELVTLFIAGLIQAGYILGQAGLDAVGHLADAVKDWRKPPAA